MYIVRKGNEYFHLVAEETLGGGVNFVLIAGTNIRPNKEYFSHFWNSTVSYCVEKGRNAMKAYIEGLQLHCGLTITGAAALGFED